MNKQQALQWINNSDGWGSIYAYVCIDRANYSRVEVKPADAIQVIRNSLDLTFSIQIIDGNMHLNP